MSAAFETALAATLPWRRRAGSAFVEAYSARIQGWAIVAEAKGMAELDADDIAQWIVEAVNAGPPNEALIAELSGALQTCLECDGRLDFSAEQDVEAALRRAGERRKG